MRHPPSVQPGKQTYDIASSGHALMRALRTRSAEVQLTKVIGAMAAVDSDFATGFVRALLDQATKDCPDHEAAREALGPVPERVVGRCEYPLVSAEAHSLGRADLVFTDKDPRGAFTLLVEIKLYAELHDTQLSDYRDWAIEQGENAAVIAVTRDLPTRGELAAGEPGYLGSVRWGELYAPLKDNLSFDDGAREMWRCFLDVLDEQGDLGMTEFDAQTVRAWAHARAGAEMLKRLLGQIARATEAHTREQLTTQYPDAVVGELAQLRDGGRVRPWLGDGLTFFVRIPAGAETGFHVHAWAENGEIVFGITVLADPRNDGRRTLLGAGFRRDESTGWYTTHPGDEVLDSDDRASQLAHLIAGDITTLIASRFLEPELADRVAAGLER